MWGDNSKRAWKHPFTHFSSKLFWVKTSDIIYPGGIGSAFHRAGTIYLSHTENTENAEKKKAQDVYEKKKLGWLE